MVGAMAATLDLRLIGVTDLHAHLRPYDYFRDRPDDGPALAKAASVVRALRREQPHALTFDNGDLLQGTPLGDGAMGAPGPHPMIAALAALWRTPTAHHTPQHARSPPPGGGPPHSGAGEGEAGEGKRGGSKGGVVVAGGL